MLRKFLLPSLLGLLLIVGLGSCKKYSCDEPISPCQEACELEPMMGFCWTPPVEIKYYFDPTTGSCREYVHIGDVIPFETLAECQACGCERLVVDGK